MANNTIIHSVARIFHDVIFFHILYLIMNCLILIAVILLVFMASKEGFRQRPSFRPFRPFGSPVSRHHKAVLVSRATSASKLAINEQIRGLSTEILSHVDELKHLVGEANRLVNLWMSGQKVRSSLREIYEQLENASRIIENLIEEGQIAARSADDAGLILIFLKDTAATETAQREVGLARATTKNIKSMIV